MRLHLIAVGRMRNGPLERLYAEYEKRLSATLNVTEIEIKGRLDTAERRRRESEKLRAALPKGAMVVALDDRGKSLKSREFADFLRTMSETGPDDLAFVIGGADGLSDELRGSADRLISLGPMTWPHMLVRVMLAEQLYRAEAILSGHPYHRE